MLNACATLREILSQTFKTLHRYIHQSPFPWYFVARLVFPLSLVVPSSCEYHCSGCIEERVSYMASHPRGTTVHLVAKHNIAEFSKIFHNIIYIIHVSHQCTLKPYALNVSCLAGYIICFDTFHRSCSRQLHNFWLFLHKLPTLNALMGESQI